MKQIEQAIVDFASFIWGLPLLILLIGGGIYLLFVSKFLPFRFFGHAIQVLRGKYDDPNDSWAHKSFSSINHSFVCYCWDGEYFRSGCGNCYGRDLELFFGCG